MSNEYLDKIWEENPEYIRRFYDNFSTYEKLCSEVEYIIRSKISTTIETAHITSRAKSLKSFCEKIIRKDYQKPFHDITDFSGVRLVYLYVSDKRIIEDLIEKEFEVIEKIDKVSPENADTFGYGALHYLVKIKEKKYIGARYDDLKDLVCEIQIRTILQDAWAVVAHHLSYKQESDIPTPLKRKMNALSGLFETADDQFESIKTTRSKYQDEVSISISKSNNDTLLKEVLNLDSLIVFINWKYPDRGKDNIESISTLLEELKAGDYQSLFEVNRILDRSEKCFLSYEKANPPKPGPLFSSVGVIRVSIRECIKNA